MRWAALALALLAAPLAARADVVSAAPDAVAVTIYRIGSADAEPDETPFNRAFGLALVVETRTLELPAGASRISFRGVADAIVPQSAMLQGLPAAIVEQNFDYDLLTPGSLLTHAVGQTVRLIRTNPATGAVREQRVRVAAAGEGGVVLQAEDAAEALHCSGLPERLVFDTAPPTLADRPTLSVRVQAPAAGRFTVRLAYLATGLNWRADYVAKLRPDGQTLDLKGWITLSNQGETSFVNAPTQVVAGTVSHDANETAPIDPETTHLGLGCWTVGRAVVLAPPPPPAPMAQRFAEVDEVVVTAQAIAGVPLAKVSDLGDYKLYTLPEPTTVAARQTKQVAFLDQPAVRYERIYAVDLSTYAERIYADDEREDGSVAAHLVLRLENREREGLGKPLPGGRFAVFEPAAGERLFLAGQAGVAEDTPIGNSMDLSLGRAMDLVVEPRIVAFGKGGRGNRTEMVVRLVNLKPVPVTLEYRHRATSRDFEVVSASQRAGRKGLDAFWSLKLAPGSATELRYTVESR